MKALIACGGTGGHIYPGLAIASFLKDNNWDVVCVGRKRHTEESIIEKEGIKFYGIAAEGLPRKPSIRIFHFIFSIVKGFIQASFMLLKMKPDIVIGTGGYVCFPVMLASRLIGIPTLIHEQNFMPGLANRFLSRFVNKVAVSFPGSERYFPPDKVVVTGNPLRKDIFISKREEVVHKWNLYRKRMTVLVFGGSQGAQSINKAVIGMLDLLQEECRKIQFVHLTGMIDFIWIEQEYKKREFKIKVLPYLDKMGDAFAVSDLVISRSGATTCAEIMALGKPSILIPYPHATANHQEMNARYLVEKGAAILIRNKDLTPKVLADSVLDLLHNPQKLHDMSSACRGAVRHDAIKEVVKQVYSLV